MKNNARKGQLTALTVAIAGFGASATRAAPHIEEHYSCVEPVQPTDCRTHPEFLESMQTARAEGFQVSKPVCAYEEGNLTYAYNLVERKTGQSGKLVGTCETVTAFAGDLECRVLSCSESYEIGKPGR